MMKATVVGALTLVAIAAFAVLPFLAMDAPIAYDLYFNQKIFYYHAPAAITMFLSVFVSGIASIGYLATRKPSWDDTAAAAGELAVIFGAIVMVTGPIWAKIAWGTWWVWEARLTSSLLLWMVFIAYTLIRRYGGPGSERLAAGLAIFGMVDVPLVYFAVNFWRTQHPTNSVIPSLRGEMRMVFLLGIVAYFCLYAVLLVARRGVRQAERRLHDLAEEMETA